MEAIKSLSKMKDFVTISLLETTRLMNIDLLFRGNAAMDEGSSYITLHRVKAKFCSNDLGRMANLKLVDKRVKELVELKLQVLVEVGTSSG